MLGRDLYDPASLRRSTNTKSSTSASNVNDSINDNRNVKPVVDNLHNNEDQKKDEWMITPQQTWRTSTSGTWMARYQLFINLSIFRHWLPSKSKNDNIVAPKGTPTNANDRYKPSLDRQRNDPTIAPWINNISFRERGLWVACSRSSRL
jgi:hypothetical protein